MGEADLYVLIGFFIHSLVILFLSHMLVITVALMVDVAILYVWNISNPELQSP